MKKHRHEIKEHHMYEGEEARTKMMHLMHSDTMVVVVAFDSDDLLWPSLQKLVF